MKDERERVSGREREKERTDDASIRQDAKYLGRNIKQDRCKFACSGFESARLRGLADTLTCTSTGSDGVQTSPVTLR